jgi:hypothetical protein
LEFKLHVNDISVEEIWIDKHWNFHLMWVCHHGIAHPSVADEGYGLQKWRIVANILNADNG